MKKKALPALLAVLALGLVGILMLFVVVGGAIKKKSSQSACDDTSMATGASYTGDLGTIRAPWVGAATYTSKFGMRVNPGNLHFGENRPHEGVDIAETPSPNLVVSATKGTVKKVWTSSEGANVVTIDVGGNTTLDYIHLASFAPGIKAGDKAWPGKILGQEGATGNASGPHLHFQINVGGKATEPWAWMKQHGFQSAPAPSAEGTVLPAGPAPVASEPKESTKASGDATAQPAAASSASGSSAVSPSSDDSEHPVTLPQGTGVGEEYRTNPPLSIPADFLAAYKGAGKKYGIPWQVLAGIGMAEMGHGRNKAVSSAGATGPMQFLPSTWAEMGDDGNGDGIKDINNPLDAIYGAANYLSRSGAKTDLKKAILTYNHAQEYVNSVLSYAKYYAGGKVEVTAASGASTAGSCDVAGGADVGNAPASSAYEKAALAAAEQYLGTPYVWGGGNQNGPTGGGFDCSGLSMYVVAQATKKASGKELDLSHLTSDQLVAPQMATVQEHDRGGKVDTSHMRVGDVIIFNLDLTQDRHPWNHAAIYIGNNKVIHAPNVGQTVKVSPLSEDVIGKGGWKARRPIQSYTGGSDASTSNSSSPTSSASTSSSH